MQPQLVKSKIAILSYIAACIALSYALIKLLQHVLIMLEQLKTAMPLGMSVWLVNALQYGAAALGMSMALAAIFTLVEIQTTGRKRVVSRYWVSFTNLFLSIALFTAALIAIERLIAPTGFKPLLDFRGQENFAIATYSIVLAYVFVSDVMLYWVHRLEHTNKALWYLHAIHHAEEDLDSVSSAFHPISNLIRWLIATLPLKFLLGINFSEALVLVGFFSAVHFFQHTRAPFHFGPLGLLIGDNRFHFVHHSVNPEHYNKNFAALFPIIDMIFGTYERPGADRLPETGLPDRKGAKNVGSFLTGKL